MSSEHVFFVDANGNSTDYVRDPKYAGVDEIWDAHVPETVRGSAQVCVECGEAWPCTALDEANKDNFRLMTEDVEAGVEFPGV